MFQKMNSPTLRAAAIGLLVGLLSGLGIMGWLRRPKVVKPDRAHAAVVLPDGKVKVEVAEPVKRLPAVRGLSKDEVVVRRVEVDVAPDPITIPHSGEVVTPPVVHVFLEMVRQPDGHIRVVASADGGKVVGSIDIPIQSQTVIAASTEPVKEYRWTVTAERVVPVNTSLAPTWGAQVLYARGPFVGGIGANRYEGRLILGMRF